MGNREKPKFDLKGRLTSVRLAIFLFIAISLVSILGTFIPQGREPMEYISEYGERLGSWILKFGLADVYHSPVFILLLFLLFINLFSCLVTQLPNFFKKWKILSGRLRLIRSGPVLTHISMICILLGAMLGVVFSRSEEINIQEGEIKQILDSSLSLKLNNFRIDYYDRMETQVSDFVCEVSLWRGSARIENAAIRVNHPLTYQGHRVYLVSYREFPTRIRKATVRIIPPGQKPVALELLFGQKRKIPGTDLDLELQKYLADFRFDLETGEYISASMEPRNPAVYLVAYRDQKEVGKSWVFLKHPGPVPGNTLPAAVEFAGYEPVSLVNLMAKKDPGLPLIWIGFILGTIGVCLGLFRLRMKSQD
ncbi:MAG: cytochrome c biogenesis protein ResB [Proteobacteria bacterium]|nr:cytochrome c biogenesis protein ResB [Pseudomonadota bacterium]